MTEEERKAIGSKGGKASAEAKAHAKTFKEAMQWALELPAMKGNPTVDKIAKRYPGLTNRDAMAIAMALSVTVSIAAEISGMFNVMLREKRVVNDTSFGRTSE